MQVVHAQGLTMPQVAAALSCWACVGLEVVHANQTSPSQFVAHAKEILSTPDTINGTLPSTILLNYLHSGVGEVGGGHFSPLAAYDDASDRFLVRHHHSPSVGWDGSSVCQLPSLLLVLHVGGLTLPSIFSFFGTLLLPPPSLPGS